MNQAKIMQPSPHDSFIILVFGEVRFVVKFRLWIAL